MGEKLDTGPRHDAEGDKRFGRPTETEELAEEGGGELGGGEAESCKERETRRDRMREKKAGVHRLIYSELGRWKEKDYDTSQEWEVGIGRD